MSGNRSLTRPDGHGHRQPPPRQRGVTLIELMIALVVVAITLGLAMPAMQEIIKNNRLSAQANDLVASLSLVRSQAIKRSMKATICKSADGVNCNGSHWEDGWIVFSDIKDGSAQMGGTGGLPDLGVNPDCEDDDTTSSEDCILFVRTALEGDTNLRSAYHGYTYDGAHFISGYTYDGTSLVPSTGGSFVLCDDRGAEEARAVIVSAAGRVRMAVDTDDPVDGIVNDHLNNNVTCP